MNQLKTRRWTQKGRQKKESSKEDKVAMVMSRFGSDRLSHVLRHSIIGAEGFHSRVRDGIVCITLAITTKSTHYQGEEERLKAEPLFFFSGLKITVVIF